MRSNDIFVLPFTLQTAVQVEIVMALWRHHRAIATNSRSRTWDVFFDLAEGSIRKLRIPLIYQNTLLEIAQSICWQLHGAFLFFKNNTRNVTHTDVMRSLRVTSLGIVDYRKSAEALRAASVLSTGDTYRLSQIFCLDDNMPVERMALNFEHTFAGIDTYPSTTFCVMQSDPIHEFMLAIADLNEAAARYFWKCSEQNMNTKKKLNAISKSIFILMKIFSASSSMPWHTFPLECLPSVYLFLLSRLTEAELPSVMVASEWLSESFNVWPFHECSLAHERLKPSK